MTQKIENLSALVDGELHDEQLLDAIKSDAELADKWQSYHLIRDGLRKEMAPQINFDIAANVAAALESEPAILAPKKSWRDLPLIGSVVPFAKQGGQMAVAASVAVAMIIGVQQFNQPEVEQPFNSAPALLGIQGGLSPVSLEQTRTLPRADASEQRRVINAYLNDHKQQLRFKAAPDKDESEVELYETEQSSNVENIPQR
ncbi:sigma-E factor negative regulatory protein [Paraglaciecola sp. L1A13]|uniref:sigma-E factor negative regulatory protein n=1 Tax=Paraglaciecola sp. L1A13 TaxID=2686359 RepID=UPI00131AC0DE|nr:RseA family anti-sigma factor [Paraglaciecola sp. L1A13]|tara:strand:- start:390 stop:992 length:603 start_codon:yes stop_codon:yes gene_type:complete